MSKFHERLLAFSEGLFQQALERVRAEQYTRASIAATASSSPLVFLLTDGETPPHIADRSRELLVALQPILSEIRDALSGRYGERFLSGRAARQTPLDRAPTIEEFYGDLFEAAHRAQDVTE